MTDDPKLDGHFLARLDERTLTISRTLENLATNINGLQIKIHEFDRNLDLLRQQVLKEVEENYLRKSEFSPVKKVVYGAISFLLLTMGAVITGQHYHFFQ